MDTASFWKLIDQSRLAAEGDPARQIDALGPLLDALPEDEIVAFQRIFSSYFYDSYTWPLWGAAYVIGGGCSDDGFDYFRGWLISRGEEIFTAASADPDKLATLVQEIDLADDCQVEGWQSVAIDAWCRKTGRKYADFPSHPSANYANGPAGDEWTDDDLEGLYPQLCKRFF